MKNRKKQIENFIELLNVKEPPEKQLNLFFESKREKQRERKRPKFPPQYPQV